jgi:hypothetical protein
MVVLAPKAVDATLEFVTEKTWVVPIAATP